MPDQVFTAEAMQACADRGHRWRWVRTWHAQGFEECATCGSSKQTQAECPDPLLRDETWQELPRAHQLPHTFSPVAPLPSVAPPSREAAPEALQRDVDATPPRPRKVRTPQHVERNAEIVRLVALGRGPRKWPTIDAVARQFGIHPSRVSQIVAKHQAAASVATTGGS